MDNRAVPRARGEAVSRRQVLIDVASPGACRFGVGLVARALVADLLLLAPRTDVGLLTPFGGAGAWCEPGGADPRRSDSAWLEGARLEDHAWRLTRATLWAFVRWRWRVPRHVFVTAAGWLREARARRRGRGARA